MQVIRNEIGYAVQPFIAPTVAFVVALAAAGAAAQSSHYTLTLQGDQFQPSDIQVPAGQRVELVVLNQLNRAAEFESNDLHREKVVTAGGQITVYVGPLRPGSYEFFDDFHPTTRGHLIAK